MSGCVRNPGVEGGWSEKEMLQQERGELCNHQCPLGCGENPYLTPPMPGVWVHPSGRLGSCESEVVFLPSARGPWAHRASCSIPAPREAVSPTVRRKSPAGGRPRGLGGPRASKRGRPTGREAGSWSPSSAPCKGWAQMLLSCGILSCHSLAHVCGVLFHQG